MKKHFSLLAMAAMAAFCLTSCEDDEDDNNFVVCPVETSDGVFVINSGNMWSGIAGTLTYYDYSTGTATQKVYQAANGVSLGDTPNHAVVYGSKIYIVGSGEKTIFVADRNNKLTKVTNIEARVNNESVNPREAVSGNGYVYVSTYDNTILVIDTLTNSITNTYKCGYYTEGLALHDGYLYTADSNQGGFGDKANSFPSISKINLTTKETVTITDELIHNPTNIYSVGGRLFFLDMGNYADLTASLYELTTDGKVKYITDATAIAADNKNKIYIINAPYGASSRAYKVFDTTTDTLTDFCDGADILSPNKISIDPVKGYVYITSYNLGSSGLADSNADGYCVIYNEAGDYQGQFDCGVGAGYVVPNFSIDYVQVPQ